MKKENRNISRRSFIKVSSLAGGGLLISFAWPAGATVRKNVAADEWFELNSYIKIAGNGAVSLMAPNPEFGSNVKTTLPMIVADELHVDWKSVLVEQADFFPKRFERQFTGGSQAIRMGWKVLRTAGATGRQMLINAAAQTWNVPASEITTKPGMLLHETSGKKATYGEMASTAATLPIPKDVKLKKAADFSIIGSSQKNVDGPAIVTGKPLYGIDYKAKDMLIAMIIHPPAFGMKVKSVNDSAARTMPGVKDIFTIKTLADDYERNGFDTTTFTDLVVVLGKTTWDVMNEIGRAHV